VLLVAKMVGEKGGGREKTIYSNLNLGRCRFPDAPENSKGREKKKGVSLIQRRGEKRGKKKNFS